jgi:exopolyphosphatase / guanosine-5'-triphosphate,3'-diphosphate pyrophosphatase
MAVDTKAPEADVVGYGPEGFAPSTGFTASVLDLGFNSAKLATYHVGGRTSYRIVSQEDAKVKLGEELDETGFLAVPPMERTLRVLKMFREIVDFESPRYVLPVATSAVREAANRGEFLHLAEETSKFKFRVLSEQEEALLSYFGAVQALRIPTGVFFDLGGGTLAMVYAEDFRVKKVICLPLGARRLTYLYGNPKKGGLFVRKDYERMREHITELLPSRKELRLSKKTQLIGVGGTVRAIASYHADKSKYPFEKLHNYVMDYDEVAWTTSQFFRMKRRQMRALRSMGQARAETMAAGSCVVRLLMKSLGVSELVASTHGLREGTLALFLHDHRWFNARSFEPATIDRQLSSGGRAWMTTWERLVGEVFSARMITEYERSLLLEALKIVRNAPQAADLKARFHELIGVDSSLSHVDQLKVVIAIMVAASGSYANVLVDQFMPPLRRKDKETIKRLAAAYQLLELIELMKAGLSISGSADSGRPVKMEIVVRGVYAEELLARAISTVREDLKIDVDYSVIKERKATPPGAEQVIAS